MRKFAAGLMVLVMAFAAWMPAYASVRHSGEARGVLEEVNRARAAEGLSALTWESSLENFAYTRANEIITLWSHTRPNGQEATNYPGCNGENLAAGTDSTAAEVVEGWLGSPSHRANILDADYTSMAVACVEEVKEVAGYGEVSFYYWVQLFHAEGSSTGKNAGENGQSRGSTGNTPGDKGNSGGGESSTRSKRDTADAAQSNGAGANSIVRQKVEAKAAVEAVRKNGSAVVDNKESVSAAVLREMSTADGKATLVARTFFSDAPKKVQGQLTLAAAAFSGMSGDLKLGVYAEEGEVEAVRKRMNKWYNNKLAVVRMEQDGHFPAPVQVAVKADLSGLDRESLVFYAYSRKDNTIRLIENPDYSVDRNGFLRFTTGSGGYIIIAQGELRK